MMLKKKKEEGWVEIDDADEEEEEEGKEEGEENEEGKEEEVKEEDELKTPNWLAPDLHKTREMDRLPFAKYSRRDGLISVSVSRESVYAVQRVTSSHHLFSSL